MSDNKENTNPEQVNEPKKQEEEPTIGATQQSKSLTSEEVQKMIQAETDRVRTEYSKKIKSLEAEKDKEKEALLKEKMTEEEKSKYELQKRQQEIEEAKKAVEERDRALLQKELNLKAIELLKENEIDINFREFVIGNDEESTVAKVESLKKLWQEAIQSAVEGKFKENGRKPQEPPKEPAQEPDSMPIDIYAEWWKKNRKDKL